MSDESPRLQEFQSQVDDLRLSGGRANPERTAVRLAIVRFVVAVGAVGLFVRASLTRYFRYWLVRLVYEDRANTDRIVEAIRDEKS